MKKMKCSEIQELMPSYTNSELPKAQIDEFDKHLSACPKCRVALDDYQFLALKSQQPYIGAVTPSLVADTMERIKAMSNEKSIDMAKAPVHRWLRPVLVIAASTIILTLVMIRPWSVNPEGVIARAYSATEELQSYRSSGSLIDIYEGQTWVQSSKSEFVVPDRMHGVLSLKSGTFEYIIIGDKQYVREADDASARLYVLTGSLSFSKEYTLQILDSLINVRELPDETLLGVDCRHLRGEVDYGQRTADSKKTTKVELWIGKDDYLMRQIKREAQVQSGGELLEATNSIAIFYDFNEPITIEPPLDAQGALLPGWQLVELLEGYR